MQSRIGAGALHSAGQNRCRSAAQWSILGAGLLHMQSRIGVGVQSIIGEHLQESCKPKNHNDHLIGFIVTAINNQCQIVVTTCVHLPSEVVGLEFKEALVKPYMSDMGTFELLYLQKTVMHLPD